MYSGKALRFDSSFDSAEAQFSNPLSEKRARLSGSECRVIVMYHGTSIQDMQKMGWSGGHAHRIFQT